MGPSDRITHVIGYIGYIEYIGLLGTGFMQVFFLGRAPRTKETARFSEVASGNLISTCIPRVDGKSTDPRDWGVTDTLSQALNIDPIQLKIDEYQSAL